MSASSTLRQPGTQRSGDSNAVRMLCCCFSSHSFVMSGKRTWTTTLGQKTLCMFGPELGLVNDIGRLHVQVPGPGGFREHQGQEGLDAEVVVGLQHSEEERKCLVARHCGSQSDGGRGPKEAFDLPSSSWGPTSESKKHAAAKQPSALAAGPAAQREHVQGGSLGHDLHHPLENADRIVPAIVFRLLAIRKECRRVGRRDFPKSRYALPTVLVPDIPRVLEGLLQVCRVQSCTPEHLQAPVVLVQMVPQLQVVQEGRRERTDTPSARSASPASAPVSYSSARIFWAAKELHGTPARRRRLPTPCGPRAWSPPRARRDSSMAVMTLCEAPASCQAAPRSPPSRAHAMDYMSLLFLLRSSSTLLPSRVGLAKSSELVGCAPGGLGGSTSPFRSFSHNAFASLRPAPASRWAAACAACGLRRLRRRCFRGSRRRPASAPTAPWRRARSARTPTTLPCSTRLCGIENGCRGAVGSRAGRSRWGTFQAGPPGDDAERGG
ncbi:hypothetical protein DFJ74DRAFT_529403 [Hyaloraphidium curvatum]|nr:hypothetical protein DFJ74DRAFT_529403 [Hyaloraphidium curvatum]